MHKSNNFRWGIVGTGHIANKFAKDLRHLDNHKITVVCSRDASRASEFMHSHGATQFSQGHCSLIEYKKMFDAVYVATNTHLHYSTSMFYLSNCIPVLCEKPFVLTESDGQCIIDTAQKMKTPFMEALWSLHLPLVKQFLELVRSGQIGEIFEIEASVGRALDKNDVPRIWRKDLGGGALFDSGIYAVALILEIMSAPNNIHAIGQLNNDGTDDTTNAVFEYRNCVASMSTSITTQLHNSMFIRGTEGVAILDGPLYNPTCYTVYRNSCAMENINRGEYVGVGLREQARHFEFMVVNGLLESPIYGHEKMLMLNSTLSSIASKIGVNYA